MRCRSAQKQLALFVGGDLPKRRTPKLLSHVDHCADCADELEALKHSQRIVGRIIQANPPPPLPPDFSWKVHQKILEERLRQPSRGDTGQGVLRWKSAFALGGITWVLLLTFGVSWHVWRSRSRTRASDARLDAKYPTVESITVPTEATLMTLKLENDPSITIVWIFAEEG